VAQRDLYSAFLALHMLVRRGFARSNRGFAKANPRTPDYKSGAFSNIKQLPVKP